MIGAYGIPAYLSLTYLMKSRTRTSSLYWLASMRPRSSSQLAQREELSSDFLRAMPTRLFAFLAVVFLHSVAKVKKEEHPF